MDVSGAEMIGAGGYNAGNETINAERMRSSLLRTSCSSSAKIIFAPRKRRKRSARLKAGRRKRSMEAVQRLSLNDHDAD